jgi:colanic acid biosynthesis glycosyl transferase WcaI
MQFTYRRAAAVVMIDPLFVAGLRRACPTARVEAVRNGIDLAPFAQATRSETFLRDLDVPPGSAVVMYAGNVGRSQDLETVIDAVGDAGAHIVIHGGGATLDRLKRCVEVAGHKHVHFSGYRDRNELGAIFASADLHVVPLKADIASASVPSKLLSIFAAGRPAIVTAEPGTAAAVILAEADGGWLVPPGSERALVAIITEALGDPAEIERRGQQARNWAMANAGSDRCAREYEKLLSSVVQQR